MRKKLLRLLNIVAAALGLSLFGTAADSVAATNPSTLVLNCEPQQGMSKKQEVECACQEALDAGTIEALESFLVRYGEEDSACTARATTALNNFAENDNDNSVKDGGPRDNGGYGQ